MSFLCRRPQLLVIAFRGRQHGEKRQGPVPTGPGDVSQPHQGHPTQPTGLDGVTPTGAHGISVDPQGADPWTLAALQGLVDAEDQRAIASVQMLEQQPEQDIGCLQWRPGCPVQHVMVASIVSITAEPHDPQRRRHRALTRCQDRTHQQHLGLAPSPVLEQDGEGNENGYNGIRQGKHRSTYGEMWGQPSLPGLSYFTSFCTKSS